MYANPGALFFILALGLSIVVSLIFHINENITFSISLNILLVAVSFFATRYVKVNKILIVIFWLTIIIFTVANLAQTFFHINTPNH